MSSSPPHRDPMRPFVAVVPVKPPARGKSRLLDLGGLDDGQRRRLAAAFAIDTVTACVRARLVERVLVATDDAAFSSELTALGCAAVPDGDTNDLNAALRQAVAEAGRRWPDLAPFALCADLPALRPDDLDDALASLSTGTASFVADAAGVGTTLYAAPQGAFDPRFGAHSREAHLAAGAREVHEAGPTLRRDVDDLEDLRAAAELGLGRRTSEVLVELGLR